jgi:hypothetical protein
MAKAKTLSGSATAGKGHYRPKEAVDNTLRFKNGDVSLDEAVARNGGLVIPKKPGILFSSW